MDTKTINDRDILATFPGDIKNTGGLDWVTFSGGNRLVPLLDTPGDYYVASTGAYGGGGFRVGILNADGTTVAPNLTVDVVSPDRYDPYAKVNWPSSGSKSPGIARVFAAVLMLAADVAAKVNAQVDAK